MQHSQCTNNVAEKGQTIALCKCNFDKQFHIFSNHLNLQSTMLASKNGVTKRLVRFRVTAGHNKRRAQRAKF